MSMGMVPYTFHSPEIPRLSTPALPGYVCCVLFTVMTGTEWMVEKLRAWYADRDEVTLVATATSAGDMDFIVLEWLECEADTLLLDILRNEEMVEDFFVYTRELEG